MSNLNVKNLISTNATLNNLNIFNQQTNFNILNGTLSNANITNLTGTNTVMTNITTGSLNVTNAIMTNITTTGLNTTSVVPLNGSAVGSLGWIKYYENNFTSTTGTLLSITADGDTHYAYMFEMNGSLTTGSNTILIRINGASTNYNSYWQHYGTGTTLYNSTVGFIVGLHNVASSVHTTCYISAVSGFNKIYTGYYTLNEVVSSIYMGPIGGGYFNTTNITSMSLVMTGTPAFTGTVTIYRKR